MGVRFGKVYVGGYGGYGILQAPTLVGCPTSTNCKVAVHEVSAGVNVLFHIRGGATVDPWVGGGVGYEGLYATDTTTTTTGSATTQVVSKQVEPFFEIALQAGLDLHIVPALSVGPFVALEIDAANVVGTWPMVGVRITAWPLLSHAAPANGSSGRD